MRITWTISRERMLKRICTTIANRVQRGWSVDSAARTAARKWNRKELGFGKRLRLSASTLTRIFYKWKRSGDKAFTLAYRSGERRTLPKVLASRFRAEVLKAEVTSRRQALARLPFTDGFSESVFYRCVPKRHRRALTKLHRARLNVKRMAQKLSEDFCAE
jgi:hypothetical protein